MHTPNPSRQKKNAQRKVDRKGKSNKRFGGTSPKSLSGYRRSISGYGSQMSVPSEATESGRAQNKKQNKNRHAVHAKHKRRLKKNV